MPVFRKTRYVEKQIDEFLDKVSEGGITFNKAICDYMSGDYEMFEKRLQDIDALEGEADTISRDVEAYLYRRSLIPEQRGDVLGLLETIDNVIDVMKHTMYQFYVERPAIPEEFHSGYCTVVKASTDAAEEMIKASRAFFNNISAVNDHLHKVHFFEKEADDQGILLKKQIFDSKKLDLAHKQHLRYFAQNVEKISDKAEDVAYRLAIYAIKRTV